MRYFNRPDKAKRALVRVGNVGGGKHRGEAKFGIAFEVLINLTVIRRTLAAACLRMVKRSGASCCLYYSTAFSFGSAGRLAPPEPGLRREAPHRQGIRDAVQRAGRPDDRIDAGSSYTEDIAAALGCDVKDDDRTKRVELGGPAPPSHPNCSSNDSRSPLDCQARST